MATQYSQQHPITATTPSITTQRGRKRSADLEDLRQPNAPQNSPPPSRRVLAMITSIPQSVHGLYTYGIDAFCRFLALFKQDAALEPNHVVSPTRIDAVPTDYSGRKRRAVDATPLRYPPQLALPEEQDSDEMMIDAAPQVLAPIPSSFNKTLSSEQVFQRQNWYKTYFLEQERDRKRRLKQPLTSEQPQSPKKRDPLRDSQINGLIAKAHRAQGGSFAQKAAQKAAEEKAAREAAEREAAEEIRRLDEEQAALDAARYEDFLEEERLRAEEEERLRIEAEEAEQAALRAAELIMDLPADIVMKVRDVLLGPQQEREQVAQLGSFPIQKISFQRMCADDNGTDSWLDDDSVNAWYTAITEAKNRQTGYVKKDGNVPAFSMLNTGWWAKATKEGPQSLKRWTKRAAIGGTNLLKCERLFLPINMGNHWTLLIINGTDRSIEYLDSLGGDGKLQYQIARALLKSELGDHYLAQEWTELKRNRSSKQDNMSDCGVFTCFNGLAAAKARPYKEVAAYKMRTARAMMAGVLLNGGFGRDFDL